MNARNDQKSSSPKTKHLYDRLRRKRGIRSLYERFLIVCEDSKSAPNYFKKLRTHLHVEISAITVEGSGGRTQPMQVVAKAIERKKSVENNEAEKYDKVFAVVDGDYGKSIQEARSKAKNNEIDMVVSTPCFEYWVLLHFEDYRTTQQSCSDIISQLKKHWPAYDKGKANFSKAVENYQTAAKRAKNGCHCSKTAYPKPEDHNPCSEIYQIIEAIQKSRDQSK